MLTFHQITVYRVRDWNCCAGERVECAAEVAIFDLGLGLEHHRLRKDWNLDMTTLITSH